MNRMDITIYVKWSCNLEHPEKAEKLKNLAAHSRDFSRELAASLNSLFQ